MGLDMFLCKKTYVKKWTHQNPEDIYDVVITKGGNPTNIKPERITEITEEVAYWRKANAIHGWFVDNIQDGVDNCAAYSVYRQDLQTLLDTCKEVLEDNSKAEELLPVRDGFFFGNDKYDEWYFNDIKDTVGMLEECLSDEDADHFEYHASW
jgi:hypothetical protein